MRKTLLSLFTCGLMMFGANAMADTVTYIVPETIDATGLTYTAPDGSIALATIESDDWKSASGTAVNVVIGQDTTTFKQYITCGSSSPKVTDLIPTSGCAVKITPAKDGTLKVAINGVDANKNMFFVEETAGVATNLTATAVRGKSGNDTTPYEWTSGNPADSEKFYGTLEAPVKAGSNYYVYATSSKFRFSGFMFTYEGGGETAINEVKEETGAKVIYDLAGRRVSNMNRPGLYIVNNKKVIVR